nr:MAG TPA: hypothetical protein [Caudoviricetes sp.]
MAILQANRLHLFRVLKKSMGKYQVKKQNEYSNRRILLQEVRRLNTSSIWHIGKHSTSHDQSQT